MAQLRRIQDQLTAAHTTVAVISFGSNAGMDAWLAQTRSPFALLHDPARAVYRTYGLGKSFWRVWSPQVMGHYLKLMLQGERLRGVWGDPHQLGGDFIIGPDGRLRLTYYSQDPTDRPAIDDLLAALRP